MSADIQVGRLEPDALCQVHSFSDVTEDLAVVVLFAPAEGARQPADG